MAKLLKLPSRAIISLFAGTLDFYVWNGIPCVRSWPRKPKLPRSPAVQATASDFGAIATALSASPPTIVAHATALATGTAWTWRDLRYRAIFGNLIR